MWKKIDPTYIPSKIRIDLSSETPICTDKELKQPLQFSKEYGTISEFYFLFGQLIHFGLMHSIKKYLDVRKIKDSLEQ
jgi:hypothetical protein